MQAQPNKELGRYLRNLYSIAETDYENSRLHV